MAETVKELVEQARHGFASLAVGPKYQEAALGFLETWLASDDFQEYVPQITHLIREGYWDYLLDSFYQVIPFGTGGRRGAVGVGPNRINPWTIQASAQGHAQFLLKRYGDQARERGVAFTYDVRQFFANQYFNDELPSPIRNLTSKDLAREAAEVYAANGLPIYMFDDVRTTPQLAFMIRYLHCVGGAMFSASHNPPADNGKKVYDEYGGQLIPPEDEALVDEVTQKVTEIRHMGFEEAKQHNLIRLVGDEVDQAYIDALKAISLSQARDVRIAFTPLHGCGDTSVLRALTELGFAPETDPATSNPSGRFENVTFNIPNPEVVESFDTPLKFAKKINADIILNSDPDADRIGVMVRHADAWQFVNGNEIAAILTEYVLAKRKLATPDKPGVVVKTAVTTNLVRQIAEAYEAEVVGELLVGFKYIGQEMNKLEAAGRMDEFALGCEESHGYITGNYARDKDAAVAGIWLAELAAELKQENQTLIDYLDAIYTKYGYFRNYLTEIRMLGAVGAENIRKIQVALRSAPPKQFGDYTITGYEDCQDRQPIVSETDRVSKDVLVFELAPPDWVRTIRVTVRPSGTEPKSKMYFEIGTKEPDGSLTELKVQTEELLRDIEKKVLQALYKIIGVDFPDRGFLLFWQLPLSDKLRYFEVEEQIAALRAMAGHAEQRRKLDELLKFLGADPIEKVDAAFQAKYGQDMRSFLALPARS